MSSRVMKVLEVVLAALAITSSIAAGLVHELTSPNSSWFVACVAGSVAALTGALLVHFKRVSDLETIILGKLPGGNVDSKHERLLLRLMAEGYTHLERPSRVWSVFWANHCDDLVHDKAAPVDKLRSLTDALLSLEFRVLTSWRAYRYMQCLLQAVEMSQNKKYRGTATVDELRVSDSWRFVSLSRMFPDVVSRILFVRDLNDLRHLDDEVLDVLRQTNDASRDHAELRYVIWNKSSDPPNFGVYGDYALGELDLSGSVPVNKFTFDPQRIRERTDLWEEHWAKAKALTDSDIQRIKALTAP